MSRGKGQSLITLALFTGIVILGLTILFTVTVPVLENLRDSAAIDSAMDMMSRLEAQIERVADGGEGSQVTASVSFSRGELLFDAADDEVAYEIDTDAEIIAPHTSRQIGNLLISAMASTTVTEDEVDGQDCWRMENEHISVCIRKVEEPEKSIASDTVGFWRFSRGGGQVVVDNSSRGNNGTLGGSSLSESSDPSRVSGLRGNGLEFDGGDEYVEVGDDDSLEGMSAVTISSWIHPDSIDHETYVEIARKQDSYLFSFQETGSQLTLGVWSGGSITETDCSISASDYENQWVHVAGTYDGSTMTVYRNGNEVCSSSQSGSVDTNTNSLMIGSNQGTNEFFDGTIDEVRVYNRSLTAAEVQYLYNSSGYLDYVDTRELLLNYRNKDEDKNLSAEFMTKIDTGLEGNDQFTMNGTGTVTPHLTGSNLGQGRVTADISSFYGIDYRIVFQIFSDSDFLQARVED